MKKELHRLLHLSWHLNYKFSSNTTNKHSLNRRSSQDNNSSMLSSNIFHSNARTRFGRLPTLKLGARLERASLARCTLLESVERASRSRSK